MIPAILEHQTSIAVLCRKYGVSRLDVFGSATNDGFDPVRSDLDFLVVFGPSPKDSGYNAADQYFGLLFDLEELFRRPIDLVCARAMRNPYFIKAVEKQRQVLYAA